MKTFNYENVEWIYFFPNFVDQDMKNDEQEYLFLYQHDITQERIIHNTYVRNFMIDKHPDKIKDDTAWKIIGFKPITKKEKLEFNWEEYTTDSKFEVGAYEILVENNDNLVVSVMYTYYNSKKFDINTKKFKILEYRKAQYSESMPIEEGVYRVVVYNKYTNTRKTIPAYMIDNKFIFENGLVIGDTITLVSECLTRWIESKTASIINAINAPLCYDETSDAVFITNNQIQFKLIGLQSRFRSIAIYKNNSRCRLGLDKCGIK